MADKFGAKDRAVDTSTNFGNDDEIDTSKTTVLGRAGDLGLSALKSAIAVPEIAVGLANLVSGGKAGKAIESAGIRFKDAKDILDAQKSDAAKEADRKFRLAEGFTGKLGAAVENPSLIANTLVESAAPMFAGGVVGRGISMAAPRLAGYAGAIGEGVVGGGMAAEQIRQESTDGELSGKQAALAGASGLATGLLGLGGRKLADRFGVGDIDTALAGGARTAGVQAGKEAPGMLKRIGGGALSEGVFEELPQSVSEQMLQNAALDRDPMQGVDAAAAMGLLSGGLMGGGMGVVSGQPKQQPAPAQQPEQPPEKPSQRMGLDPASGALTAAAAIAVDSGASPASAGTGLRVLDGKTQGAGGVGEANFVEPDFQTRKQTLAEQMASPENREKIRARFGDDGLNQVMYYAQAAGRADIPAKTADNMLQVAERMMGDVLLQPLGGNAQLGGMVRDPATLAAPDQPGVVPAIGVDQTPSGRFTVDAQGNAVPESAVQQSDAQRRAGEIDSLGRQPIRGRSAPQPLGIGLDQTPSGRLTVDAQGNVIPETAVQRSDAQRRADEIAALGQQQTGVRNAPEAPLQPVRRTLTDTNTANMLGTAPDPVAGLVTQRRLDADAAAQRKAEEDQRRFEQARSGTLLNVPAKGSTLRPLSVELGMELVKAKANGRTLLPQEDGFLVALRKEMGDDAYAKMAQVAKAPFLFKKQERTAILKPNQDAIAAWEVANAALPSTSKITSSGLGVVTAPTQQSSQGIPNATQAAKTKQAAPKQQGTPAAIGGVQGGANAMPVAEGLGASSAPAVQGGPIPAVQVQQGVASQVTAGSKPSKADNLAALQQKLAGQTKPTPTTPPAQTKATPAPEAGPTNQGATNGQKETLLKAEQPTGAAAMVSGAPVADTSLNRDSSWVIREKATGNVVMETFDRAKVDALNTAKYEAVPIQQHLAEQGSKKPSDTTKLGGFTENVRKAAGKVAPAPVAAQQTAAEAPAKKREKQEPSGKTAPATPVKIDTSRQGFSSKTTEVMNQKDSSDFTPDSDERFKPTSQIAMSMPTFKGNKRKMLAMAVSAIKKGMNTKAISQIDDWFGGGGMWSTSLANAALPNVKRIMIAELNPLRIKRIQWMHERGDKLLEDMHRTGALAVYRKIMVGLKEGGEVSPSPFQDIGLELAGLSDKTGSIGFKRAKQSGAFDLSEEGKVLLAALGDLAFNNRGSKIHDQTRMVAPDGQTVGAFLAKAVFEFGQAQLAAQSFRDRGGVYEYFPAGSSYDLAPTDAQQGENVLSLADPPYYNTTGYKGAGPFSTGDKWNAKGYAETAKLLKTLVDRGNHVLYTDEAWWLKPEQMDDRLEADAILGQINSTIGNLIVAPEKVGNRYEQLGIHNPRTAVRRPAETSAGQGEAGGRGSNPADRGRGGDDGRSGGEIQGRANEQRGAGRDVPDTAGQVAGRAGGQGGGTAGAKPGRLNHSTGSGKADARNAALTSVVRNGGNSTAVLTDIAKNSSNPAFKLVAKAIMAKGLPFDLRIRTDFTDGKVAHYSTDGHFVEFDPGMPFNLEQVLLHEAVHAVTSKYVASFGESTPMGKELAALFKLAEQHAKKTGAKFYGLTNSDEFLAEVMANGAFAQWLDTVPVPLQKSALIHFVRAVARFFGIQKADGATAQAMDVFERIMLAQSDLQAEASQKLSASKDAAAVAQAYGVDTEEDGDSVYFGDAEVSLNREDNTYIVTSENEFTPDHRAAVAWAENNGFASELAKSQPANLTPVEAALRDALEATGGMGAAKDMAYEALRRQGVAVKWQDVVDAAKKMGRGTRASKPGADAIRSDTDASPRTPASTIRASIAKAYGNLLDKLEAKGLVTIAQTEREAIEAAAQARADKTGGDAEAIAGRMMSMAGLDVKYSANGNIEGFFDRQTGKSFLVADNLTAASAPGTLMHEVGIHMAAGGKMEALFKRAGSLLKTGTQNEFIQRVKTRMARAGETSDEEAAAYIATEYENNRLSAPVTVGKWMADLTAAVRAWLFSKGAILKAEQLTVADIAAVARANARSMARGRPNGGPGGGQEFSRTEQQSDPDIRFSRGGGIDNADLGTVGENDSPSSQWDAPLASSWDDKIYKLQDKNIDTKRVIQAIKKMAGDIQDKLNVYLQEELYHGRTAKRVLEFGRGELNPALDELAAMGYSIEDLEEYMHARHAPEANVVLAARNPTREMIDTARAEAKAEIKRLKAELSVDGLGKDEAKALKAELKKAEAKLKSWTGVAAFKGTEEERNSLSGMKTEEAEAYFRNLPAEDAAKLKKVAEKMDAIMAETSNMMVAYHLESQETVDGWNAMYRHYIPLHREGKDDGSMGTGQGFSIKGREVKGRTGSKRKVVNIVAHIAEAREKTIVRGEKNRVAQALVGLVAKYPNADFWKTGAPPSERVFDRATGKVKNQVNPAYKSLPNVVMAKVMGEDGKVKEVAVTFNENDERAVRMAGALKNLDTPQIEGWLGTVAKATRYFAAVNTQYNPIFGAVNIVRDVQGAMINLGATPLADQKMKIARDTVDALAGIYRDIRATRRGDVGSSKWSELYEQFQHDGGQTGFRNLFETTDDRSRELKDRVSPTDWAKSPLGRIMSANGKLTKQAQWMRDGYTIARDWLSDYNETMESATRLAVYKAALDKGMTREQAASMAKNITVNFNRKGTMGTQAGALYAFFNAAMQGTARMGETLVTMEPGQPKTMRLSAFGKKVVYGGVLLGAVQALALAAGGFGDEEPPDFERERNLLIPTGWTGVGPDKGYIKIPMPLGLHVIPGIGRMGMEFALSGGEDPAKAAIKFGSMMADAFNPIGNAGLSMQTIAPTVLDPLAALVENKDWTGKNIARESFNKDAPMFSQHKDSATFVAKFLAEMVNYATGGNEYVGGALNWSPDQIDYLIGQVFGGVGRELSKVEQTATGAFTGDETPIYKVPLLGRFAGSASGKSGEANAFYTNADKLNRLETELKGMVKDGKSAEAAALRMERPESRMIVGFNMAERQVQKLRKQKSALIEDGASAADVRAVDERITAIMQNMNQRMLSVAGN